MTYSDEDIRLMLRFQNGEESCFEQLVERHKNRVFNIAYRFLGNYQDAEDLAQQIFIKVYHASKSYKPQAKFTTWLYAICRNTCLKALRKNKPNVVSIHQDVELTENKVAPQYADPNIATPSESLLNNEQSLLIKNALDALPANQKMAVILCRYDRLSYEEIAIIMKCSVKAVKSLLHRAKINLKEKLKDYFK